MFTIKRRTTSEGVLFTLVDPNGGIVAQRFIRGSKEFIAPIDLRSLQGMHNTRLVLDCGGAR